MTAHARTNRIRVLHIVGDSRFGGIARIILAIGRMAQAEGWQVDVLTTDPVVRDALERHGFGVVDLDVIRRQIHPFWDLGGLFRLQRFLRRRRYHIVHTHTSKAGFVGRVAAWLAGVPLIVHTVHGFAFHEASPPWVRMAGVVLERFAAQCCDRIVTVSQFHRAWAVDLGICEPQHIQAIPNGIVPLREPDGARRAGLRRQLGAGDRDLLILNMARLADDKGLAYLIKAAALLRRSGLSYRICIAGEGPARARLERLADSLRVADAVQFLGFRDDIGELLAAADMVVLPSLREGLSISLLEAMAAGKPIILSSIGSHREMASQAEMARLVPPADPAALAAAIRQVAGDPELMFHLAATARALFETRYTEHRMVNEYRQLYLSLVRSRPAIQQLASRAFGDSAVRKATEADLGAIVAIHRRTFGRAFLTQMGAHFLRSYYDLVLHYRAGIMLVSEHAGVLNGFVCGFADPAEFYRLMWRNRRAFALPALSALLRRPALAFNVLQGVRRVQDSAMDGPTQSCELSSIAVTPEASGNGLGRRLVEAFLKHSWAKRADCVYLTTDAEGNDAANALYRDMGFHQTRRFLQRRGRWMNEYRLARVAAGVPMENHP